MLHANRQSCRLAEIHRLVPPHKSEGSKVHESEGRFFSPKVRKLDRNLEISDETRS